MRTHIIHIALLSALVSLSGNASFAQTPPTTSPTTQPAAPDDVAGLMQEHRYDDAMRAIDRVLNQGRGGGASVDRQAMLFLRAECQLQLKRRDEAMRTLTQIKQEADRANDVKSSGDALALFTLIQRSPNLTYRPGTLTDKTPISILDPDLRKAAFTALLADELAALNKQLASARAEQKLTPIVQIAEAFPRVQAIERVASGTTSQTDSLARELSQWAGRTLDSKLAEHSDAINKIAENAVQPSVPGTIVGKPSSSSKTPRSAPRGLSPEDAQVLHGIIADCRQIPKAIGDFTRAFGDSDLTDRKTVADQIATRANNCLGGDYDGARGTTPSTSGRRSSRSR